MKKIAICLLALCFPGFSDVNPYLTAIAGGDPSTFVHGCVSAITGDFFIAQDDIVIKGAKPLTINRFMLSRQPQLKQHSISFINALSFSAIEQDTHWIHLSITEPSGVVLHFHNTDALYAIKKKHKHPGAKHYKVEQKFTLNQGSINRALTNCAQAELGARLNYRNYTGTLSDNQYYFYVDCGNGRRKIYERYYESPKLVDAVIPQAGNFPEQKIYHYDYEYRLVKETLPDGSAIYYHYAGSYIAKIRATNSTGEITYAWAEFTHHPNSVVISTSDKRTLIYENSEVNSPEHPHETLVFQENKLKERRFPEERGTSLEYIPGTHRVKALLAPVGQDTTHHPLFTFKYPTSGTNGHTEVFDPDGNKTVYHYTNLRPILIQRFRKEGASQLLINEEKITWGNENTPHVSYLLGKSFHDNTHTTPLFAKRYHYDDRGNIEKEELYGNISGDNRIPPVLDTSNLPLDNGCEKREIVRNYSKDGLNLLTFEKKPNNAQTRYFYRSGTDLIEKKFIGDGSRNYLRHFFQYNANNLLEQKIIDDGHFDDIKDIRGVSHRKIISYMPYTDGDFIHMPHIIEERCLDLETQREFQTRRRVLSYDKHFQVEKEEVYDARNELRYTLTYQYENGLLTLETNPIGQKAIYKYDANRNKKNHIDFPKTLTVELVLCSLNFYKLEQRESPRD